MLATAHQVLFAFGLLHGVTDFQRPVGDERLAMLHYRSGWEHFTTEAWAEAAREFQAAIDIDPEFKLAYYGLGRASMAQKRFVEATVAYEKCRDIYIAQTSRNFTNKSDADRIMSDDLMQYDTAISRLQSGPQTAQTQAQIAQLQSAKQRLQNRLRGTVSMSIISNVPPFVSLALGSAYFRTGHMPEAEKEYKNAIEADAKMGEAHSNLAALYLQTGRIDDAERAVKAAEKAGFKVNPMLKEDIVLAKKKS
jgi:tetratricopeptide (TPR) repeat protein